MKPGHGARKGGAFEREICKRLSLFMSGKGEDDLFWRSSMSGGRATVKEKTGGRAKNQVGDISAISPAGHPLTDKFLIECKHYRELGFIPFFLREQRGALYGFWQEAVRKAKLNGKMPMLIARQNGRSTVVLIRGGEGLPVFLSRGQTKLLECQPDAHEQTVVVYLFDDLFPRPKPRRAK